RGRQEPSQGRQGGEGNQELQGGGEPQAVADARRRLAEGGRDQDPRGQRHEGRLPEVVQDRGQHHVFALSSSCLSRRSASRTSSRVSLPVWIRWAITGWARPPNRPRKSSIRRRWADERLTHASKMWALPIFLTRRTTFLTSSR